MTDGLKATRRAVLASAGAMAAAPALAAVPAGFAGKGESEVARLWKQAGALKRQMQPYAADMAASAGSGLPGWMRLQGAANTIGNRRYDTLIAILKTKAESLDDLHVIAQAAREEEIAGGPATWARFQFDAASRDYHLAA
jgi:hypothetical protein